MTNNLSKSAKTLDRILDAGLECYGENGVRQTRLETVAKKAGIGRTTLYRYIGNRDDLLAKVLLRDAELQRSEIETISRDAASFSDSIIGTVSHVMRGRRDRAINKVLFNEEHVIAEQANLSPQTFIPLVREILAQRFETAQTQGEIRADLSLEEVSEWLTRIILSLVTHPGNFLEDDDALRRFLTQFVLPSLSTGTP